MEIRTEDSIHHSEITCTENAQTGGNAQSDGTSSRNLDQSTNSSSARTSDETLTFFTFLE